MAIHCAKLLGLTPIKANYFIFVDNHKYINSENKTMYASEIISFDSCSLTAIWKNWDEFESAYNYEREFWGEKLSIPLKTFKKAYDKTFGGKQ